MRKADGQEGAQQQRTAAEGDALVVAVIRRHGDVVLRIARRYSLCDEDAADASQRAMEIFLRHSRRLEADTAHRWLYRVVRNEALTVREQRQRLLGPCELQADLLEARHVESPEDRVIGLEATAQAAEALLALKDSELQALVMQASGDSMARIATRSGWTATKVNRAVTEGRRRLREQRDAIADGRECERWRPALSALVDGRADARQVAAVRPHLRNCGACRAHLRALHRAMEPAGRPARVAAVAPFGLAGLLLGPGRWAAWLGRVHDAVGAGPQERLALRVLKVQSAAEALSAGKVAAVAASAAAIASGGAAVVEGTSRPGDGRTPARASLRAGAQPDGGFRSVPRRASAPVVVAAARTLRPQGTVGGRAPSVGVAPAAGGRSPATAAAAAPEGGPSGRAEFRGPSTFPRVLAVRAAARPPAAPIRARETGVSVVPTAVPVPQEFGTASRAAPPGGTEFAP